MNLLICLIIMFTIYTYFVSRILVRFFPKQLGTIKYKWPIGFFSILGLLQLVSFPMQYYHISMFFVTSVYNFIFLCLTGIILIEFYLTVIDKKKHIKNRILMQLIDYILIFGFIIFNFIICYSTNSFNNTNADQSFYITLVENNLNAFQINMILPLSGVISPLSSLYNFQSFYLFLTYLSMIFHIDTILIMAWFVPFILWLTASMTILNIIHYFKLSYKWYLSIFTFLILWTFTDLFEYLVRYNCYGSHFRLFMLVYLMIFYYEYFKNQNKKNLILCALLWFGAVSVQSTCLFLGIFLMLSYGLYDLFITKKRLLIPLVFSATPLLLYASLFMGYRGSWMPAYLILTILIFLFIFSLFSRTRLLLDQLIYNRVFQFLIILAIILVTIFSIWMIPHLSLTSSISPTQMIQYLIGKYEFQEQYLIPDKNWPMIILVGFRRIVLFLNLYLIVNFKALNGKLKFIIGTQIIIILVVYNPLVCGFISTALTGIVYNRIEDIVLSIFSVTAVVLYITKTKNLKYFTLILSVLSILYLATKTENYLNQPYNQISNINTYNHLYRMDQSLVEVAIELEKYIDENMSYERPKVLTTNHHLNYFTSHYEMIYTVEHDRRLDDELYRKQYKDIYILKDIISQSYDVDQEMQRQFMPLIYKYDVDFVITSSDIDAWIKQELQTQGECIFKNNNYYIYKILID